MLETLFWLIVFPFVFAFILGFMSYGISEIFNSNKESQKSSNSLYSS